MFNANSVDDLMQLAEDTPYGKKCSALWAEAARRAGAEGRDSDEIWCYLKLAQAFTMGGEVTRMVAPFMWVDKRRKERPDLFNEHLQDKFAWYYKYVLLVLRDIPQASAEECFTVLREMREFYQGLGDSLKAYYLREYYVYTMLGRTEDAEEAYRKWKNADVSEHSDCAGCDPQHEVRFYAQRQKWEQAVAVGDKALANPEDFCSSQPQTLYCNLLVPWLYTGQDERAWPAHAEVMQGSSHHKPFFEHLPSHIEYLELSGKAGRPHRLERGLGYFVRFLPWWEEAETPIVLMDNAIAAARLLAAIPDQDQVLEVKLPGRTLPWLQAEDVTRPSIGQAHQWCADIALRLAQMFDARPGLVKPHMVSEVRRRLYEMPPVPQLSDEGEIADVSGRFKVADVDYRIEGSLQPASSVEADEDGQPLLVAIDVNGPWRTMTPEELEEAHAALNTSLPTVYSQRLGLGREVNLEQAQESDPARALLLDAFRLQVEGKYMEAVQNADTAMRTETSEPISVRLMALHVLSATALQAGYYEESAEAARHRLNVSAACGLPATHLQSAVQLVEALFKLKQYSEAAEVASTTLSALETAQTADSEFMGEGLRMLRRQLIFGLGELDHDTAAGEESLKLAETLDSTAEKIDALGSAMNSFRYDHEYERAFAVGQQLAALADSYLLEAQVQAVAEEDSQAKLVEAAKVASQVYLDVAHNRTAHNALVDDAAHEFVNQLLDRRLEVQLSYLVDEGSTAEFYRADNAEDRGLTALSSGRFDEGLRFLEQSASEYLAIERPALAARALNTAASAQLEFENYEAARELVGRVLAMLDGTVWANSKAARRSQEILDQIKFAEEFDDEFDDDPDEEDER